MYRPPQAGHEVADNPLGCANELAFTQYRLLTDWPVSTGIDPWKGHSVAAAALESPVFSPQPPLAATTFAEPTAAASLLNGVKTL